VNPAARKEAGVTSATTSATEAVHQAIPLAKTLGIEVVSDRAEEVRCRQSKTNFLRAVRCGCVEAVSRPLHTGRSVVVVETDVIDAEGRPAARLIQSQIVLRS
jgi:uncharacterized protein (TIGR00369 family)